ncbi:MAG TPA: ABC transporter substrate-binding protein [Candidatus Nanoarchaeia archaeon]|nr:ABC transporter substrate-binding protein [Candidatus Nanoarchaeia archaeon]
MRVVSLQPSATVTLDRLGLLDCVVACTRYCADVCPGVRDSGRVIVSDSWTAQAEQILAARPDLVIASVPYQLQAVAQILKAGVRFLGLAPRTLADIYTDMQMIAGVMNAAERGHQLVSEMQQAIRSVREKTASLPKPTIYCEEWGKPIIHSQPWVAELVEAAGARFVGIPGAHTGADSIRAADPDIIIAAWCGAGDRVPLEKIIRDREWSGTKAALHQRVYCIADELLNTPAPTLIPGLHAIAWAAHSDAFQQPPGIRRISTERV